MLSELFEKPRLLIVARLPEPEALPMPLLDAVQSLDVILLGYWELSEQTSPEQAREEFQEEANEELDTVEQQLGQFDVQVERKLVFTANIGETVEQTIKEEDCDAVLAARPAEVIRKILVPIHRADQQPGLIADFISGLVGEEDIQVTLLRFPESDEDLKDGWAEDFLHHFTETGIPEDQLRTDTRSDVDVVDEIVERAENYDLVVIGECRPTMAERLFGEVHEQTIKRAPCPVIVVVRKSEEEQEDAEEEHE